MFHNSYSGIEKVETTVPLKLAAVTHGMKGPGFAQVLALIRIVAA